MIDIQKQETAILRFVGDNLLNLSHTFKDTERTESSNRKTTVFDTEMNPVLRSGNQVFYKTVFFDHSVFLTVVEIPERFDFNSDETNFFTKAAEFAQKTAINGYLERQKQFILLPNLTVDELAEIELIANKQNHFADDGTPFYLFVNVPRFDRISQSFSESGKTLNHPATMSARCHFSMKTGKYLFTKFF